MLDINPSLLFFEIALFLLMIALLNMLLYKPLLAYMDARNDTLRQEGAALGQNQDEREALLAEANAVLAQAKKDSAQIRADAINSAKHRANESIEETKRNVKQVMDSFAAELSSEKEQLRASLSSKRGEYIQSLRQSLTRA